MRTRLRLTRDGDAFVARLAPSQTAAMREALIYLRHRDDSDLTLTLQLGTGRETVDALIERLSGGHTESRDIRFRAEELHAVHSALTTVRPSSSLGRARSRRSPSTSNWASTGRTSTPWRAASSRRRPRCDVHSRYPPILSSAVRRPSADGGTKDRLPD